MNNTTLEYGERIVESGLRLEHPSKTIIGADQCRALMAGGDYLAQRKYDGEFGTLRLAGATLVGEFLRAPRSGGFYTAADRAMFARNPGGWWAIFTVLADGHRGNLAGAPTWARMDALRQWQQHFTSDMIVAETVTNLAAVLAAGGEGVCLHPWGQAWGKMLCHKAADIFTCRVLRPVAGTQSVEIADAHTGQPRGRVTLRGGKCDQVRAGTILRVEAMGLTDAGKLRQPNPCREWLVKY